MMLSKTNRALLLQRLNASHSHKVYLDSLLTIYHDLNDRRTQLSPDISELTVFGGALYFVIVHEAKLLNLIDKSDIDMNIYRDFKLNKTTDLDIQGSFINSLFYEEELEVFAEDVKTVKSNFLRTMQKVYQSSKDAFTNIQTIIDVKSTTKETFSLDFSIQGEVDHRVMMECRPQISVCLDKAQKEEHILEILIQVSSDEPRTKLYNLFCLQRPFLGESIIESITQQIFPTERAWLKIDKGKSTYEIFGQMKTVFDKDPLQLVKFKQGFYRSYMIYYVLQKAQQFNVPHLLELIIPTNEILLNKLFFLKSNLIRKIAPQFFPDALRISTQLRSLKKEETASFERTVEFLELILSLWRHFDEMINRTLI